MISPRKIVASSALLLIIFSSFGSNIDSVIHGKLLGVNFYHGTLMYHHKVMEILREKPVNAIELSWILVGNGKKLWHKVYRRPEYGFSYILMDLGSPNYLGYAHGILPFVNFPVSSFDKRFSAGFRIGSGLSYVTKIYDRTENYKNSAISTHLNAIVAFNLEGRYSITENLSTRLGLALTHISNGTFRKPNSGLNNVLFSAGIAYCIANLKVDNGSEITFTDNKNRLLVIGSGSYKETKGAGGPRYAVGALSVEYTHSSKTLLRYGFSLDLMYDQTAGFIMDYEEIPYSSDWQMLKSGVTLNSEIMLDRLSAVFYFGKYIYNHSKEGGPVYQRIGLRYRIMEKCWLHFALKTHWGSADYIEFGVGYKIL